MDQIQIGKFIAACRKEKGLTQAQLAEKMGVSDRAVSKWETGATSSRTLLCKYRRAARRLFQILSSYIFLFKHL